MSRLAPTPPTGVLALLAVVASAILSAAGCAAAGGASDAPATSAPGAGEDASLVPPGYGTLRQDDVSLSLRSGDLQVKVTPLAESVIRLTAPDTYRRLHGIAESHRSALVAETGRHAPTLFLVSFFSLAPDVTYEPEDVEIVSRGLRYRPLAIRPVTPGWGAQRLDQRETRLAVYAFGGAIDLDGEMAVEYRGARNARWRRIVTELQAEREKVRARAGGGGHPGAGPDGANLRAPAPGSRSARP